MSAALPSATPAAEPDAIPSAGGVADLAPGLAASLPPGPPLVARTSPTNRRGVAVRVVGLPPWVGKGLLAIAVLFFLQEAKVVLLPLAVALILTFLLYGPVRLLSRRGVPPQLGAAIVLGAALTLAGSVVSTLAVPAADWWSRAPANIQQVADILERLRAALPIPGMQPPRRGTREPDPVQQQIATESVTVTRTLAKHVLGFGVTAIATIILLYFLLASEYRLLSRTVEALPDRRARAKVLGGMRRAQRDIGRYLGTMTIINSGVGIAVGLAMLQLGLANPLLWGALAGAMNFVPFIGPSLVAGGLLVAGVLTFGEWTSMVAPAACYMLLHSIEANLVTPLVVGRRLRLSPMAVFLSVMLWGWLWGVAGAFIAVPMLLGIRAACQRVTGWRLMAGYLSEQESPPTSLRKLMRRTRPRIGLPLR
jgi:predicted PurR-regulated permease PerM